MIKEEDVQELINEFWKCTNYDFTDPVLIKQSKYFQQILANQKLRRLVEKEIKGMNLLFNETKDHSVGYSLIRLQSLLDEAKK